MGQSTSQPSTTELDRSNHETEILKPESPTSTESTKYKSILTDSYLKINKVSSELNDPADIVIDYARTTAYLKYSKFYQVIKVPDEWSPPGKGTSSKIENFSLNFNLDVGDVLVSTHTQSAGGYTYGDTRLFCKNLTKGNVGNQTKPTGKHGIIFDAKIPSIGHLRYKVGKHEVSKSGNTVFQNANDDNEWYLLNDSPFCNWYEEIEVLLESDKIFICYRDSVFNDISFNPGEILVAKSSKIINLTTGKIITDGDLTKKLFEINRTVINETDINLDKNYLHFYRYNHRVLTAIGKIQGVKAREEMSGQEKIDACFERDISKILDVVADQYYSSFDETLNTMYDYRSIPDNCEEKLVLLETMKYSKAVWDHQLTSKMIAMNSSNLDALTRFCRKLGLGGFKSFLLKAFIFFTFVIRAFLPFDYALMAFNYLFFGNSYAGTDLLIRRKNRKTEKSENTSKFEDLFRDYLVYSRYHVQVLGNFFLKLAFLFVCHLFYSGRQWAKVSDGSDFTTAFNLRYLVIVVMFSRIFVEAFQLQSQFYLGFPRCLHVYFDNLTNLSDFIMSIMFAVISSYYVLLEFDPKNQYYIETSGNLMAWTIVFQITSMMESFLEFSIFMSLSKMLMTLTYMFKQSLWFLILITLWIVGFYMTGIHLARCLDLSQLSFADTITWFLQVTVGLGDWSNSGNFQSFQEDKEVNLTDGWNMPSRVVNCSEDTNVFGTGFTLVFSIIVVIVLVNALINVMSHGLDSHVTDSLFERFRNEQRYKYWNLDHWSNKPAPINLLYLLIDLIKFRWSCCRFVFCCSKKSVKLVKPMYNVENIVETNLKVALRFLADSNLLEKLDFQGSTTLHNLVKYKDVKLINKFLSNTMDHIQAGNQVSTRNQFQESIYHTAVRYSNYEFIRQFLTDNSIHLIDKNSHVPFLSVHYSTDRKSVSEIFKIFTCFNKYREKEKTPTDLYGNNLMHLAIQSKNLYVYDALMKTEWASIMAAEINSNEDTPLTQAYKTMVIDVYSRSKNEMHFSAKDFFWHIFNWHCYTGINKLVKVYKDNRLAGISSVWTLAGTPMNWLPSYMNKKSFNPHASHGKLLADADVLATMMSRFSKELVFWLESIEEMREVEKELIRYGKENKLESTMRNMFGTLKSNIKTSNDTSSSDWLAMLRHGNPHSNESWYEMFLSNYSRIKKCLDVGKTSKKLGKNKAGKVMDFNKCCIKLSFCYRSSYFQNKVEFRENTIFHYIDVDMIGLLNDLFVWCSQPEVYQQNSIKKYDLDDLRELLWRPNADGVLMMVKSSMKNIFNVIGQEVFGFLVKIDPELECFKRSVGSNNSVRDEMLQIRSERWEHVKKDKKERFEIVLEKLG